MDQQRCSQQADYLFRTLAQVHRERRNCRISYISENAPAEQLRCERGDRRPGRPLANREVCDVGEPLQEIVDAVVDLIESSAHV